ncbi:3-oxoacid CoA-transferase subunit B [Rhodoplanes sp. TEM]|uniref:3-oxoacid CoA-transferase subunit B n=2 Tax=Rhodoplanes TaxID=29407 RepID=A0ABT5J3Z4_RHOTP|nr:3-oxoacid CoA-transferase subunit B [Rhodoplanes tepidamans]MDC7784366.1 3-oxoacid CoA-transferase subunit B [Rhodoplanes tepidamans]MDC7983370.1 3-oxoacid CoA-transferase subunit B [Rhodoplanes sp. TEM]MDQ0354505.1 3-oxoacid CoA-transferase subunit B/acetate CoA/acetoacetate CoA-transferase beta subunit [Rhodoplanes tepidamans]
MAKRAAAYFAAGDIVNLGIGVPSLCNNYAPPGVMFHTENGLIGVGPLAEGLQRVESFSNANGMRFVPMPGASVFDSAESFAIVRSGRLAATVLGGLQVSEKGDLANWARPGKMVGMGGAMDLVNGARKVIVTMELTAKGAPKILKACTYPLTGAACVDHIVTEQCVIDVTPEGLVLREVLDGVTPEEIQRQVEPTLVVADDLAIMAA